MKMSRVIFGTAVVFCVSVTYLGAMQVKLFGASDRNISDLSWVIPSVLFFSGVFAGLAYVILKNTLPAFLAASGSVDNSKSKNPTTTGLIVFAILLVVAGYLGVKKSEETIAENKAFHANESVDSSQSNTTKIDNTPQPPLLDFKVIGKDGNTMSVVVPKGSTEDQLSAFLITVSCAHQTGKLADIGIPPTPNGSLDLWVFDDAKIADIKNIVRWSDQNVTESTYRALENMLVKNTRASYFANKNEMPTKIGVASIGIEGDLKTPTAKNYRKIELTQASHCPPTPTAGVNKQQVASAQQEIEDEKNKYSAFVSKHGEAPKRSGYDGSYSAVNFYLEKALNDPSSLQIETCGKVFRGEGGWEVHCDYRAKNGFGALVKKGEWFVIANGKVISTHAE
jgi:hypothetical protein